ncbi:SHOCT domain-containing protein [Terrabacter sp. Soil811]
MNVGLDNRSIHSTVAARGGTERSVFTMDFWSFFWLLVWSFFFVAYLMMLFQIFGDLFRDESLGGVAKAIWVIVLIFFPLISALVYVIVRGRGMAERTMKRTSEQMAAQEDYIRTVAAPKSSSIEELTQAKALLDAGAISPEEFAQIKSRALA